MTTWPSLETAKPVPDAAATNSSLLDGGATFGAGCTCLGSSFEIEAISVQLTSSPLENVQFSRVPFA